MKKGNPVKQRNGVDWRGLSCRIAALFLLISWVLSAPYMAEARVVQPQVEALTMRSLLDRAEGMGVLVGAMAVVLVLLAGVNGANLLLALRSVPGRIVDAARVYLKENDLSGMRSLAETHPSHLTRALCSGIKSGEAGTGMERAAVVTSWEALTRVYRLAPMVLKAYGVIVLAVTLVLVGIELVRLYMEVYARFATTMGEVRLREILQTGSARVMALGLGGLFVFVISLISGYLFAGAVRLTLVRRTSVVVDLLGSAQGDE